MNEKKLFESGCFLPSWTEDISQKEEMPLSPAYVSRNKDLQTLLSELDEIKNRIQEIQAKEWHLAKLMNFYKNDFVKE